MLHITYNYALQTLCGAPHNVCNEEGISEVLPGEYTVWLGGSQPDARSILLTGQKPLNILLHQKEKVVISD